MQSSSQRSDLLKDLLRDVSRSFYLTLRVLPGPIRNQIGLAYLLARTTDTVADTEAIEIPERLAALQTLKEAILAPKKQTVALPRIQAKQTDAAEQTLLERVDEALTLLFSFAPEDRQLMQTVLRTISEGQELDLLRFGSASRDSVVALQTDTELDDYTYRVAGCVGEFWTRMCLAHLSPKPRAPLESLVERGLRFGKGLQLVNILRDLSADLQKGRCYLPQNALKTLGLEPSQLFDPSREKAVRPLYDQWLGKAQEHLNAGWSYVLDLPFSWVRVRLACAWPILIGLKTCEKLHRGAILNPAERIKISRPEIKRIMAKSLTTYIFPASWARLPQRVLNG